MSKQYPHTLLLRVPSAAVQDEHGDWQVSDTPYGATYPCREEAGGGGVVRLTDGSAYVYVSVIYLPKNTPFLPAGTKIEVADAGNVRMSGTVKRFSTDGKHCRLWA